MDVPDRELIMRSAVPLRYLATDALAEGVGASQILPYLERVSGEGISVSLSTFEKGEPPTWLRERMRTSPVDWHPLRFGRPGALGGLGRVARGAQALKGAALVHARGDLAAGAALLARPDRWIWDIRSFWADHRVEIGALSATGPQMRLLRRIESSAARQSDAIITLTHAAVDILRQRHGDDVAAKALVITTCVDLDQFPASPLPAGEEIRFLLSGSLSPYYEVPLMVRLVERAAQRAPAALIALTPGPTSWESELASAVVRRANATPPEVPAHVRACHVGLSVCRLDAGVSRWAAMPTKIGEFLASGRPVVVNQGLGDMDAIINEFQCGVALDGRSDAALDAALDRLGDLLADPATPSRCRRAAEHAFNLDVGSRRLSELYRSLASAS
jgi:glycosyltransferase involved in cell wall biosynthesis